MSAALLLPVGRCVGTYAVGHTAADPTDGGVRVQQVLLGAEVCELSDEQFAVWSLAHGHPEVVPGRTWTRRDVLGALASSAHVASPAKVVDGLLARGLLAEVEPGTEQARSFATRHRLRPLLLGLGNTAEEPEVFSVGFHGRPIAAMSRGLYALWAWAQLSGDLWSACAQAALDPAPSAPAGGPAGGPMPGSVGSSVGGVDLRGDRLRRRERTDATLAAVLPALHSLLAPSAACLERLETVEAPKPAGGGRS